MMMLIYGGFVFMYVVGLFVFSMKRKHLLLTLLSLEFIILSLYSLIFFYLVFTDCECYFSVIFLGFSVCEGVMGLSILVSLIRTHGNDFFQAFSLLVC
uniref:NADH-ubiquinone oxidoreductase chain 4L n=1 Tax=Tetraphalerus bruchi TaxID=546504 RepID=B6D8Z2_TETBR|nr:NADH dehydrogenase subunit 4L [Tetraphalerus bruchi]ACF35130.1 NADH dehydrogenase subunit 4L [Tetraphalerus bruchi]